MWITEKQAKAGVVSCVIKCQLHRIWTLNSANSSVFSAVGSVLVWNGNVPKKWITERHKGGLRRNNETFNFKFDWRILNIVTPGFCNTSEGFCSWSPNSLSVAPKGSREPRLRKPGLTLFDWRANFFLFLCHLKISQCWLFLMFWHFTRFYYVRCTISSEKA